VPKRLQQSLTVNCIQAQSIDRLPDRDSIRPDLILLRASLIHNQGFQKVVEVCRQTWREAAVFALFCPSSEHVLERSPSLLRGIDDFLSCPFQQSELLLRLRRLFRSKEATSVGPSPLYPAQRLYFDPLVGQSENFLQAVAKIGPLCRAKAAVLISGETGTGKELFAHALHYQGPRHGKPFIPVNCGALPDHLFENELFGHVKGAFTDAIATQNGLIMEAQGGTLFLDEIDALSLSAQVKLLRFLQNGEYRALGSARTATADVRIIAATNADLRGKVEAKLFRDDLYHRLNVLSLSIPPLRHRGGDVPLLSLYFLDRYSKEHRPVPARLSPPALQKLAGYSWPGNVRELEAVIQRTLVLSSAEVIEPEDIEIPIRESAPSSNRPTLRNAKSTAMGEFESNYLATLLATHRGNVSHAARAAGKDRRTLQRLLRKYNLDRHSFHSV
jgi:DNA-binding NtrC family response regulator